MTYTIRIGKNGDFYHVNLVNEAGVVYDSAISEDKQEAIDLFMENLDEGDCWHLVADLLKGEAVLDDRTVNGTDDTDELVSPILTGGFMTQSFKDNFHISTEARCVTTTYAFNNGFHGNIPIGVGVSLHASIVSLLKETKHYPEFIRSSYKELVDISYDGWPGDLEDTWRDLLQSMIAGDLPASKDSVRGYRFPALLDYVKRAVGVEYDYLKRNGRELSRSWQSQEVFKRLEDFWPDFREDMHNDSFT